MQNYYSSDPNQFLNYNPTFTNQTGMIAPWTAPSLNPLVNLQKSLPQGLWSKPGDTPILNTLFGVQPVSASEGGSSMINLSPAQDYLKSQGVTDTGTLNPVQKDAYNKLVSQQPQQQQSSGPSAEQQAQDLQNQLDAIYNPQLNTLNQYSQNLQGDLTGALANVQQQKGLMNQNITDQQTAGDQATSLQGYLLNQAKDTAYSQAIREYNNQKQRASVMYGMGSSVGQGLGELGAQQFARNQGQNQQSYQNNLAQLQLKQQGYNQTLSTKRLELDQAIFEEEESLHKQFRDGLSMINAQKNLLEADKNAKKLQLNQDIINRSNQLKDYKIQADQELQTYKDKMMFDIQQGLVGLNSTAGQNPMIQSAPIIPQQSQQQTAVNPITGLPYDNKNDPFANLNPWNNATQ